LKNTKEKKVAAKKSLVAPTIAVIVGMFMVSLDSSVLNVAIPT